ncbi:MAG TPA: NAD-binding protein [Pseudonocardiaceae bacterium]|jgi:Trk K+ transport system NAD-binding subunit
MAVTGEHRPGGPRLIVCGDNPLTYRLAEELTTRVGADVTVVLPSAQRNQGPRIAALPGVRVVEAPEVNEQALRAAQVAQASAIALVSQDDVGNIHAALRAQELNPDLQVVIRSFNHNLGHRIRTLFPRCEVLSDVDTAVPSFVAGALGELAPSHVPLPGRTLFVTRQGAVAADRVVCALADTSGPGPPELLPTDPDDADLVLAVTDSQAGLGEVAVRRRRRDRLRTLWWRITASFNRKLGWAAVTLLGLPLLGMILFAALAGYSVPTALYNALLDVAGAAQPDSAPGVAKKVIQTLITFLGVMLIPVLTATIVDAVVNARLAIALGRPRPIAGHVVVVGLGTVGSRVLGQLHDLGVPVVGVERDEDARGVAQAGRLGVPVVLGDASQEDVLRKAYLGTSRALIAVTNNDVTNLEAGLHGIAMRADLQVVLRLFDSDLAQRVERNFGITISRSVSYLAAPAFAAAMLGRQVLGTIPIGRRVLLIAEVTVQAGSALDAAATGTVDAARQARLIAIRRHPTDTVDLPPPPGHVLTPGDRLIVLATRAGLARIVTRSTTSTPAA